MRPMFPELRLKYRARRISFSRLFAADWYRQRYPDVDQSGMLPALHYVSRGAAEGRSPHPLFDPAWFDRNLADPVPTTLTALEHYLSLSPGDRPSPHPLFDPEWYRAHNPKLASDRSDALLHFIKTGGRQGFSPHPDFDAGWYLAQYPDVESVGVNPLVHFLNSGAKERRDPNSGFSTGFYLDRYPDVAAAGMNPLAHYVLSGKQEGRLTDTASAVYQDNQEPQGHPGKEQVRRWTGRARKLVYECLRHRPWPLIDWNNRTVVSWSAKSACTHVLIWHLDRMGLLDKMTAQSSWPHEYRVKTYYRLPEYRRALDSIATDGPADWTYLKVVRDPANRCISSYRHALAHGYADRLMSHFLGRQINHVEGYAYADFLAYLKCIDLQLCDIHHRLQRQPLDAVPFGRKILINIDDDDLESSLARVADSQDASSLANREKREALVRRAARRHAAESGFSPDESEFWLKPLTRDDTREWPKSELQGCLLAAEQARRLYMRDYAMLDWLGVQCTTFDSD